LQKRRKPSRNVETIKKVVSLFKSNISPQKIGEILDLNPSSVRNILHKEGFNLNHRGPKSLIGNENYFDNIDSEDKAYFLGWLMADGNISIYNNQYFLKIHISEQDRDISDCFMEKIQSKNKIRIESMEDKKYISISLSSKHMCQSLMSYGIVPRKTGFEDIPNNINKNMISHFIRGYFDGDGITCIKKNKRSGFISSKVLLDKIQSILNINKKEFHPSNTKNENIFYFLIGKDESRKLYDYMYNNATIWMKRKRERMDIICGNTEITDDTKETSVS